jgi:hypothetical protein
LEEEGGGFLYHHLVVDVFWIKGEREAVFHSLSLSHIDQGKKEKDTDTHHTLG